MTGKTISHYKILEEIGAGGMGVVYKAEDTKLQRQVALKFLPPNLTRDEEAKKRFIQEAQTASALEHANSCTIYEINETEDGQMFIAMAYYAGQSLREKMENGRLEVKDALDIANQIARGLDKAHRKNIIHRDIKPANIMITEDDEVIILDFGLAKLAGQTKITKSGTTLGTVSYMSPEQAQGEEVDHRSDIWSLGVILYEMLTGQLPFTGEYDMAVMYAIINKDYLPVTDLNPEISDGVSQAIARSIAKEPEDRYQSIAEMRTALQHPTGDLQEAGKIGGAVTKKRSGNRGAPFYVPLLTFFAILIVLGIYLWRVKSTAEPAPSIAILPMESYSEAPEEEWFRDSMTDALITDIARIKGLTVISYSSVKKYKNSEKSMREIADELNVTHILECSILRVGEDIRISPKLIEPESDMHIWAEKYQRKFIDILGLQGEVASAVAEQIKVKLTPEEEIQLANVGSIFPQAFEAYLKGRYHWEQRSNQGMLNAVKHFKRAIELDSTYAAAYAGLAQTYALMSGYVETPPKDVIPRAKLMANKALLLDSTLANAHLTLGFVVMFSELVRSETELEKSFKKAIELNPNYADGFQYYGWYLFMYRKFEESRKMLQQAEKLNPLSAAIKVELGWLFLFERRFDEAIAQYQDALNLDPNYAQAYLNMAEAYYHKEAYDLALKSVQKAISVGGRVANYLVLLGAIYAESGQIAKCLKIKEELQELSEEGYAISNWYYIPIHIALGEKERALDLVEEALQKKNPQLWAMNLLPTYDPIRNEPRFMAVMRQIGAIK